jgi:hypothetical protein
MTIIAAFLGAGFSKCGGVPLTSELFQRRPDVDRVSRQRLVDDVLRGWRTWKASHAGGPEEYLAFLAEPTYEPWGLFDKRPLTAATQFIALSIALQMGELRLVGRQPTIVRTQLSLANVPQDHESFWDCILERAEGLGVVTTNYDILAERGLRMVPRPRKNRPGFFYGNAPRHLAGGGYPLFSHLRPILAEGSIPLLKLHGSISWAVSRGGLERFADCRPAIRGDAAIVAPLKEKSIPPYLRSTWDGAQAVLEGADTWIIVGYGFPFYDEAVTDLVARSASDETVIHVLNPDPAVAERLRSAVPKGQVVPHRGLPNGLQTLAEALPPKAAKRA